MKARLLLVLTVALLSACAHQSTLTPETSAAPTPEEPLKDIQSFHLSDPQGPKVVAEEFESIPTEVNPLVEKWITYFQGKGRPHMERYLSRSARYEKLMKKVLRDNGLPEDLFYIALIESGFSSRATSHAAAVGYWQFIRGTGKRYGLEINKFVDERRDPVLATQAAAEYFKGLYSVFGSWYLAMASYNVGENRVKKEVMKNYTRDFWELAKKRRFPRETVNYIPKFIAAKLIAESPDKYGFDGIDYMPAIEFDRIILNQPVNLRVMAEKMNYNYEDFKALNPKYKGEIAPLKGSGLDLRIPVGMTSVAMQAATESGVDKIEYIADAADTQTYRIRHGDSLYTIARRYRTTVAYLRDLNDISKGKKLRIGMRIQVPDRTPLRERPGRSQKTVAKSEANRKKESKMDRSEASTSSASSNAASTQNPSQASTPNEESSGNETASGAAKYHIVQSGDSLFAIAQRYNTSVKELKKINKIRRGRQLRVGLKLRLPVTASAPEEVGSNRGNKSSMKSKPRSVAGTQFHVVRRGETLLDIAEKYRVELGQLKQQNRLKNASKILVGHRLLIPRSIASE